MEPQVVQAGLNELNGLVQTLMQRNVSLAMELAAAKLELDKTAEKPAAQVGPK